MSKRRQRVTADEFAALACNRCGACCERFWLGGLSPLELAPGGYYDGPDNISYDVWLGNLVPTLDDDGRWSYACPFMRRDSDGLATCTIYDRRPTTCRDFPYGRPQRQYRRCAWNVILREEPNRA